MIRVDGKFIIYIIKYSWQRQDEWIYVGDCGQWYRTKDSKIQRTMFKKRQEPFMASGDCWQETGIHGTYDKLEAFDFKSLIEMSWPEHEFDVFELNIEQETIRL